MKHLRLKLWLLPVILTRRTRPVTPCAPVTNPFAVSSRSGTPEELKARAGGGMRGPACGAHERVGLGGWGFSQQARLVSPPACSVPQPRPHHMAPPPVACPAALPPAPGGLRPLSFSRHIHTAGARSWVSLLEDLSSKTGPLSPFPAPGSLQALIDEAHRRGIAVLLDVVHSHISGNQDDGLAGFDMGQREQDNYFKQVG